MPIQQMGAIAGVVAFFVLCIYLVVRYKAKIRAAFQGFATKHGIAFTGGAFPCAVGKVDGRYTVVQSRPPPGAVQQVALFQVHVGVRGDPPRGMVAYARSTFDSKGIRLGDAELDDKLHIDAPDPAAVTAWLTPTRRAALLKLATTKHAFAVPAEPNDTGPVVILSQQGFKARLEWLEERYGEILALATQLDA